MSARMRAAARTAGGSNPVLSSLSRLLAPERLVVSSLLVSLVGVPVIMAARYIFAAYYPDYVATRVPTISKTSALEPASYLFAPGMTIVAICALTAWWLVWRLNRDRIAAADAARLRHAGLCRGLNNIWLFGGVVICLSLTLLATRRQTHNAGRTGGVRRARD